MFHLHPIASFEAPELAPYRTMRQQVEHWQQGIFVAEGEKIVRRLLASDCLVVSVVLPAKWLPTFAPLLEGRPENIPVYLAEKDFLEALTGFSFYQGVLAVGRLPAPARLESVLAGASRPWLLAAADGLSSAENLGALVRNCAAFGVQALLVGETSGSPYLRRAVRSSMGGIFKVPAVDVACLAETLCQLRGQGVRCVAAHPHTRQRTLSQAHLGGDCCLVFGSEGAGLSSAVLEACHEAVAIPMAAEVDSLNVGSAAAVFLYEAQRQRGLA